MASIVGPPGLVSAGAEGKRRAQNLFDVAERQAHLIDRDIEEIAAQGIVLRHHYHMVVLHRFITYGGSKSPT